MDLQNIWDLYLKFPIFLAISFAIIPLITAILTSFIGGLSKRFLVNNFGDNSQLIVGGVGVVLHELGHGIFAVLFGHKITHIKLLDFHFKNSTTLGSVEREWDTHSVYQQIGNFFIGIAPYYICSTVLFVIQSLLIKNPLKGVDISVVAVQNDFLGTIKKALINDWASIIHSNPLTLIVFIILAIMIGSTGYDLSSSDIRSSVRGLLPYSIFLLLVGLALNLTNLATMYTPTVWYVILLSLVFMINAMAYILISIIFTSIFFGLNILYSYRQSKAS